MKKLKTGDLFSFCRLIRKIGIKEQLKEIQEKISQSKGNVGDIGYDVLFSFMECVTEAKAEKEIYSFLSKPFEMSVNEIEELELTEFVKGIKEIADLEVWATFFKQAVR